MKPIRLGKQKPLRGVRLGLKFNRLKVSSIQLMPVRVGRWLIAIDTSGIDYDDDSPSSMY